MIFRQLYETESSTYSYLFGCRDTGQAVLLDPVIETLDRDLSVLQEMNLQLAYTLETHIHADHVTSACRLRSMTGCKIAYPEMDGVPCADVTVSEVNSLSIGYITLKPLYTPGHTDSHHSYLIDIADLTRVFTGDALLIDGCGRTDFQGGDASALYRSIHDKIFTLPGETLVYPAHDYNHRHVSTVEQERERNPRLGAGKTVDEFVEIMGNLNLPYPKRMDIAVPANRLCGDCPDQEIVVCAEPPGPSIQG
jgi:glyoxylase-like metal-dependent hydrolase (beta-lactamase superfamily II)